MIWALGYTFDFGMVKLPAFDGDGYPIHQRGVTAFPGLYFVGLPWIRKFKSEHIFGLGEDARYVVSSIASAGRSR